MKLNIKNLFFINILNFTTLYFRINDLDLTNWKNSDIDVTLASYILKQI